MFTVPDDFDQVLRLYTQKGYRVIALAWKPLVSNVGLDDVRSTLDNVHNLSMYASPFLYTISNTPIQNTGL